MPSRAALELLIQLKDEASAAAAKIEGGLEDVTAAYDSTTAASDRLLLAQLNAEKAAVRLSDAQVALAHNTDPDKQEKLATEVAKAAVAFDTASEKAQKLALAVEDTGTKARISLPSLADIGNVVTGLRNAWDMAEKAIRLGKQAFDETIGSAVEYAKQVRDLGRDIGATAEQSSMLIQAADDVMISFDTLQAGMRAAIRKGVDPTIEGLGKLADEYLRLPAGTERAKFAMDNFGRSGAELAPLLEKGSAGIREMGDEARKLGLVLDNDATAAARRFEIAVDNMNDRVEGMKIRIGTTLIPWANAWLAGADALLETASMTEAARTAIATLAIEQQGYTKDLDESTAVQIAWVQTEAESIAAAEAHERSLMLLTDATGEFGDAMETMWRNGKNFGGQMVINAENMAKAWGRLRAVLAAPISGGAEGFTESQADLAEQLATVGAELEKLEATQGRVAYTQADASISALDLANAQDDAAQAAARLAAAQAALAANTDPDKQAKLNSAYLDAAVAAENAGAKAAGMAGAMAGGEPYIINHGKHLDELKAKYGELQAKIILAQEAEQERVRRAVLGMALEDLEKMGAAPEVLGAMAVQWGLMSQVDADAIQRVNDATKVYVDNMARLKAEGASRAELDMAAIAYRNVLKSVANMSDPIFQGTVVSATGNLAGLHGELVAMSKLDEVELNVVLNWREKWNGVNIGGVGTWRPGTGASGGAGGHESEGFPEELPMRPPAGAPAGEGAAGGVTIIVQGDVNNHSDMDVDEWATRVAGRIAERTRR